MKGLPCIYLFEKYYFSFSRIAAVAGQAVAAIIFWVGLGLVRHGGHSRGVKSL